MESPNPQSLEVPRVNAKSQSDFAAPKQSFVDCKGLTYEGVAESTAATAGREEDGARGSRE